MNDQSPPPAVGENWQELLDDAEAMAAEYREEGWEALVIQTGDVTALDSDPFGLSVLAPGSEFEALDELVDRVTFDTSHVYRTDDGGVRFLIVVAEATADEVAVVVPAFLSLRDADTLEARASEEGTMYTHVRPLSADRRVTFTHDDPGLFF